MYADGGKRGLGTMAARVFTNKEEKSANKEWIKQKKVISVGYELDTLVNHKRTSRGWVTQIEEITVFGPPLNDIPPKKRKFYGSTSQSNRGTLIAPVQVPRYEDGMQMTFANKKVAFGDYRMPVGGQAGDNNGMGNDDNGQSPQ